jgi:hypothetical protein
MLRTATLLAGCVMTLTACTATSDWTARPSITVSDGRPLYEALGSPECLLLTRTEAEAAVTQMLPLTYIDGGQSCGYAARDKSMVVVLEHTVFATEEAANEAFLRHRDEVHAAATAMRGIYPSNIRGNPSLFSCTNASATYYFVQKTSLIMVRLAYVDYYEVSRLKTAAYSLAESVLPRI